MNKPNSSLARGFLRSARGIKLRLSLIPIVLLILGLIILVVCLIFSVTFGTAKILLGTIYQSFLSFDASREHLIIRTVRLPRSLKAMIVGTAISVAGALMQGITRNPLADPGILGVSSGAAFSVVMAIFLFGVSTPSIYVWYAFLGAGVTALCVYFLASLGCGGATPLNLTIAGTSLAAVSLIILFPNLTVGILPLSTFISALIAYLLIYIFVWDRGTHPVCLILIGVGISAVAGACTSFMVTFGEINHVNQALVWLAGSVYGRTWEQLFSLLPWLIVFIPLALIKAVELNTLNFGDEIAQGLGSRVGQRVLLVISAVSGAVATAGTITFVKLIAPHIARQLVGGNHQGLIPIAGILGAMIVVISDLLGRVIFAPVEIPCGIVTAVIGVPYFFLFISASEKYLTSLL